MAPYSFAKMSRSRFLPIVVCAGFFSALLFFNAVAVWAEEGVDEPVEFEVQFNINDPYEITLTAEKYRQAFMEEDIPKEKWRGIYFRKAKKLYEKTFLTDPHFTYGYLSLAYTQMMAAEVLGDKQLRYKKAEKLIPEMDSESPWPSMLRGQLRCVDEKWEEAKTALEKAVQLGGDTSSLYSWLGYTFSALKDNEKAQQAYQKAIDANTDPKSYKWASNNLGRSSKPWQFPPLVAPSPPRRSVQPASTKMRLQLAEFEDATKMMGNAASIFSRLLTTVLFNARRFNLVQAQKCDNNSDGRFDNTDALITGTIIRAAPQSGEFILDIKAVHPATGNLLMAESAPISYVKQDKAFQIVDKEVRKVADVIERKLVRGEGQVVHIDGRHLMINLGGEQGVKSGFTALIIGKRERTVKNPLTGDVLSRDIYLGEILVERVEEKYSYARLLTPGRITMRTGDIVRLK